jgi:hypothetical protein
MAGNEIDDPNNRMHIVLTKYGRDDNVMRPPYVGMTYKKCPGFDSMDSQAIREHTIDHDVLTMDKDSPNSKPSVTKLSIASVGQRRLGKIRAMIETTVEVTIEALAAMDIEQCADGLSTSDVASMEHIRALHGDAIHSDTQGIEKLHRFNKEPERFPGQPCIEPDGNPIDRAKSIMLTKVYAIMKLIGAFCDGIKGIKKEFDLVGKAIDEEGELTLTWQLVTTILPGFTFTKDLDVHGTIVLEVNDTDSPESKKNDAIVIRSFMVTYPRGWLASRAWEIYYLYRQYGMQSSQTGSTRT